MKIPRQTSYQEQHKVTKISSRPLFKIPTRLQKHLSSSSSSAPTSISISTSSTSSFNARHDSATSIQSLANTMKLRMKAAISAMIGRNEHPIVTPKATPNVVTNSTNMTTVIPDASQEFPPSDLKNHTLLKQYVTFVQEETGTLINVTQTPTGAEYVCVPSSPEHSSNPLASSGAALIEAIVHRPMPTKGKPLQNDPSPSPSASTDTEPQTSAIACQGTVPNTATETTTMCSSFCTTKDKTQGKKAPSLRLKQQRKDRRASSKTTASTINDMTFSSSVVSTTSPSVSPSPAETSPPSSSLSSTTSTLLTKITSITQTGKDHAPKAQPTSTGSVIRCICTTPHEEFGAMVQCDDCLFWLHLECLKLDEKVLGETFRCPSCYIALGPSHHLTSAVTWRYAAQWKSERLAARHNSNDNKQKKHNRKSISHRRRHRHHPYDLVRQPQQLQQQQRHRQQQQREKDQNAILGHLRKSYTLQYSSQRHDHINNKRRLRQPRSSSSTSLHAESTTSSSYSSSSSFSEDDHNLETAWTIPKMTVYTSSNTLVTTTTNGNVLVQRVSGNVNSEDTLEEDSMDIDSDTTESDCEMDRHCHQKQDEVDDLQRVPELSTSSSFSVSSINTEPSMVFSPSYSSSDMDSPIEANTPDSPFTNDSHYPRLLDTLTINNQNNSNESNNNMSDRHSSHHVKSLHTESDRLASMTTSTGLDHESLLLLSRLAYLESLKSDSSSPQHYLTAYLEALQSAASSRQYFTPNASDVFLYDEHIALMNSDCQHSHPVTYTIPPAMTPSSSSSGRSDPPSAICSNDLSQFSFDAGPFWSSIQ